MKTILIYDHGEQYSPNFKLKEFDSKEEMIDYINEKHVGEQVIAAYEIYKEIKIDPFEKVIRYKIKE